MIRGTWNFMQRYINPVRKAFVKVRADHDIGGKITPLKYREAEGETYLIDRITDVRPATLRANGRAWNAPHLPRAGQADLSIPRPGSLVH